MKEINLNFGAIKDTISRLSAQEIIKESKNNTLKKFIAEINQNPVLLKQHLIFKNIKEAKPFKDKAFLAERFIQQNLNLFKNIHWEDIIKENRKIRKTLLENFHIESTGGEYNQLYNDIHTLIESTTRPNYLHVDKAEQAYERTINYLMREIKQSTIKENYNETTENPTITNWKVITNFAVNNFNKRYEHLDESDKKIFKYLIDTNSNKINYIKDLKQENIKLLDALLETEEELKNIQLLESFKTRLNTEIIDLDDTLIEFYNLNKTIKNII